MRDKKLQDKVKDIYINFFKMYPNAEINIKYIQNNLPTKTLKDKIVKINISNFLSDCGIDPATVSTKSIKTPSKEEKPNFLKDLMQELIKEYGIENLNDLNMNSSREIPMPKTLLSNNFHSLSNKLKIRPKKIKMNSLQRRCFRYAKKNNWRYVLEMAEIPIEEVERKKAKIHINETIINYLEIKKKYNIKNISFINQDDFKVNEKKIYKQIYRLNDQLDFIFSRFNTFFNGLLILEFYKKNKSLPSLIDLDTDKNFLLFKKYLFNQKQINWSLYPEVVQSSLLELYSKGSKIYDESKNKSELKLTNFIRHSKTNSADIYKRNGILIKNLQKINLIIDTGYDRQKIYKKIQTLLAKTIEADVNYLSKDYIEQHEKEFMNACFRVEGIKTNNWGKVLEIYGLNPENFIYDFSFVSKRGFIFERSINDLFNEHLSLKGDKEKLIEKSNYWYKKRIKNIGIPDFNFKNLLIDTKFSVGISKNKFNHESVSNQFKKYSLLNKDIVILTFNQKAEKKTIEQIPVKIINLKTLRSFIKEEFEISIKKDQVDTLFTNINKISRLL